LAERHLFLSLGLPGGRAFQAVALMALDPQRRKRELFFTSAAGLLLLAVIVLLVNLLSNWAFLRLDITANHAYSLSPSSRKLVQKLEDPVVITAYFTPDLPDPYNAFARYTRDMLVEYRAASKGKVRFEFAPQHPVPEFEKRAAEASLMPIQFESMSSSQLQIKRGYMGLVLYYHDKSETIPIIKDVQTLEYELTSRIARMTQTKKRVIGVTTGHGEPAWQSSPSRLAQDLATLYEFRPVNLPADATAAFQLDGLAVVGPRQPMDDKSLFAIDQWIMQGVPTAFLVDAKDLRVQQFTVMQIVTNLQPFLAHYGATVGDRLIFDAQAQIVAMTQTLGNLPFTTNMRYPFIPLVSDFEKNHPVTRGVDSLAYPFGVPVTSATAPSTVRFQPLMWSSRQSWLAPPGIYRVAPDAIPSPSPDLPKGPFSLAAVLEGTFTSYFQGKPVPIPGATFTPSSPKTDIVVIGTSHLVDPDLPSFAGTDAFMTNLFAFLSKDETLLGIRSKGQILRPLKPISPRTQDLVKILCILGVAALPVLLGLWRWQRRRAWRAAMTRAYAAPRAAR
jgi:gliding-associated putative ABC transporter substrate-binding component GldG